MEITDRRSLSIKNSGTNNYGSERANFQTKLTKEAGSPQKTTPEDSSESAPSGVSQILYKSTNNLRLRAWVNLPAANENKRHPAIIFLHGGLSFGKGDWDMTRPFREAGFIVITPILRGENGQSGNFTFLYDEVNDAIAAGEYATQQPYIDKNRIYLVGHSLGGILTQLTAMSCNIFRKAASFSGLPDIVSYYKYVIDPRLLPFDTTNIKEFEMRSPLTFATSLKCPTRLFFGTEEPWIMGSVSLQVASVAKQMGLDVEAVAVPGDHMSAVEGEITQTISFFSQK